MSEPPSKEQSEIHEKKKVKKELCVICMTNIADHLIVPCGHQCGCENCLKTLQNNNGICPICRVHIGNLVKVFQSGVQEEVEEEKKLIFVEKKIDKTNVIDYETNEKLYDDEQIEKQINISVGLCEETKNSKKANIGITLKIPDTPIRRPVDICCVIDVSGSMGEDAKYQDPEDETKTKCDGTSILDLVKHAVKAVIHTLTEKDRFSIVAFDSNAKCVYSLNVMNESGRNSAITALEKLEPLESTNIWNGIELGLESLRKCSDANNRRKFIFLLTDGQPVESPVDKEDGALKKYFLKYPNFLCQVNTFGFGYKLDSRLLLEIATCGGGAFSFLPDAKLVGTNFVNCIANAATTLCLNANLHLIPLGKSTIDGEVGGNMPFEKKKNGEYVVKLGNLQYGQDKNIFIPMVLSKDDNYLAAILEYEGYEKSNSHKVTYIANSREKTLDSVAAYVRNLVVSKTFQVISEYSSGKTVKGNNAMNSLAKIVGDYDNEAKNEDPRLNGLLGDIVGFGDKGGRMLKAISTVERFNRWGGHYLRSIYKSHQLQLCTNFIDIGIQVYGGNTFKELQKLGGDKFIQIPMIKSKKVEIEKKNNIQQPIQQAQVQQQVQEDNTVYYGGGGGGCFDETCFVYVLNSDQNEIKTILDHVKKNDLVGIIENGRKGYAKVLCVIKIQYNEELVEFESSRLKITKKHPVFFDNKWQFPIDIVHMYNNVAKLSHQKTKFVYNFLLENSHVLLVNNIRCVTFGHGIKEVYHPFYGTNSVVDIIKALPGFADGYVDVNGNLRKFAGKQIKKGENEDKI